MKTLQGIWSTTTAEHRALNVAPSAAGARENSQAKEQSDPTQILPSCTNQIRAKRTNGERDKRVKRERERERDAAQPLGLLLSN